MPRAQKKPLVIPRLRDNYLSVIENGAGTKMFRAWYCDVDGKKTEITLAGKRSCALYVTAVLKLFDLVGEIQITVHRAIREIETYGWKKISHPRRGAVVVWAAELNGNHELHKHMGFCLGEGKAISNNPMLGAPKIHSLTYRPVIGYFWHKKLS